MKSLVLVCTVLTCAVSVTFTQAADPKKDDTKKSKAPKVSARDMITKHDTDNDKKLDVTELHNALRTLKYNQVSTKNDSWKKFDTDTDGKLEQKELDALLDSNAAALAVQEKAEAEAAAKAEAEKGKTKAPYKGPTTVPTFKP